MDPLEDSAALFKLLSHPSRLAILQVLRDGEECVCHMEAALGLRQAYISQQLMVLRQAGLVISAKTQREHLTEIVELPQTVHPWFVGVQFHPEFKSTPWAGHPLFNAFVRAALQRHTSTTPEKALA